jgi:hypothetical protein
MLPLFATLVLASGAVIAVPQRETTPDNATIIPTSVAFGEIDPNGKVPTVNGVPGAGVKNWDIALPRAVLKAGHDYELTVSAEDVGFTGACFGEVLMWQIQNGRKELLELVDITDFIKCKPGHVYVKSKDFGIIPDKPGPVTVTFSMHFSAHHKTTIRVPMLIQ